MSVGVDHPYLMRLAASPRYNWMSSLSSVRAYLTRLRQTQRSKGCCGAGRVRTTPEPGVFEAVASHPRFMSDLQRLKDKLGASSLIINVGSVRQTL